MSFGCYLAGGGFGESYKVNTVTGSHQVALAEQRDWMRGQITEVVNTLAAAGV